MSGPARSDVSAILINNTHLEVRADRLPLMPGYAAPPCTLSSEPKGHACMVKK